MSSGAFVREFYLLKEDEEDCAVYKELAHVLKLQVVKSEHSVLTSGHDNKL